jgi:Transposase DDE domain
VREASHDIAETSGKEKGRLVRRRLQASPRVAESLQWPAAAQVCRLTRTTRRGGTDVVETQYAITSAPRSLASAADLLGWWRNHWGIENRVHWVRDMTFDEDRCRIRTGSSPQIFAAFRNAAITALRFLGCQNIAAALREHAYQPQLLFTRLGIMRK